MKESMMKLMFQCLKQFSTQFMTISSLMLLYSNLVQIHYQETDWDDLIYQLKGMAHVLSM